MSLVRRKSSKFWYAQFQFQGKTYVKSTKTTNKRDAAKVEQMMRDNLFRVGMLGELESVDIESAIDLYTDSKKGTMRSYKTLKSDAKFIKEHLDTNRELEQLNARDIEKLIAIRHRKNHSNATIKKMLNFIRGLMAYAKKLGYKTQQLEYPTIRPDKHKLRYLTLDEEKKLLEQLTPSCKHQKSIQQDNYDFVVTLLDLGCRHGEAVKLKWSDIDLENKTVNLFRPKVRNESILQMTDRLYRILVRRHGNNKGKRKNEYVFTNKKGGHRNHSPLAIRKAMVRAGLEDCTLHDLRHTAASRWVQNGLTLQEVSFMLGHTTVQTSAIYAHLVPSQVTTKAAEVLNSLHNEQVKLKVVK